MLASLLSPRIATKSLAQLCRRLATSLEAGIDIRTVWAREAQNPAGFAAAPRFRAISEAVSRGESQADALAATGDYFPPLFREMALVGEKTGHLAEIFARLAEHYDEQIRLRRIFLVAISWPMVQLLVAILVVGFLIWIMGIIGDRGDIEIDPLGFGLVGSRGLAIYVAFLAVVGTVIFLVIHAVRRGLVWTEPIQRAVLNIPVLGKAVETICLARLAWSLHLTMGAGMEIRQAMRLSLRSARNARYTDHIPAIDSQISAGNSIHEAFLRTGGYPNEFLDTIQVGEQSGNLAESLAILSRQYHERADAAIKTLTMLAGLAVWAAIAALIVVLIFRLAFFYIGTIQSVMPP